MRKPDVAGAAGGAWLVPQTGKGWEGCLSFHYVHLPAYHPMLQWFVVVLNHLRESEGVMPTKKTAACTHEVVIASVDPEVYLFDEIDPDSFSKLRLLEPLEVWHQFQGLADPTAQEINKGILFQLVSGALQPNHECGAEWNAYLHNLEASLKPWQS